MQRTRRECATPRSWCTFRNERGVGLMEVIVATIIATVAILALAYSFGTGRALVNRYEIARMALAAAQRRMETLASAPAGSPDLALDPTSGAVTYGPLHVVVDGQAVCTEEWMVEPYDDPARAGASDLKKVTVTVSWGPSGPAERIQLTRLFSLQ